MTLVRRIDNVLARMTATTVAHSARSAVVTVTSCKLTESSVAGAISLVACLAATGVQSTQHVFQPCLLVPGRAAAIPVAQHTKGNQAESGQPKDSLEHRFCHTSAQR